MPLNMKDESMVKNPTAKQAESSVGTSGRKAPGTRYGILIDWRGGTTTSGRRSDRYGRSLRDGN
jgi:hypothetical protein